MYYVYVLWSTIAARSYVGSTGDVEERLRRHNSGHSKSTKHGIPWCLIHTECFPTRAEAVHRELDYQTGHGREELKASLAARL